MFGATQSACAELLRDQAVPVGLPYLVFAEVAGAISRTRHGPMQALAFVTAISNLPNVTLLPLDTGTAWQAMNLAAQHGLRGADAVYAAVALQAGCTLIILDHEYLMRLTGLCADLYTSRCVAALPPPRSDEDTE